MSQVMQLVRKDMLQN